ncbi:chemotaxis protein CheB [Sphingomonas qilianensis]|uniref:protein-glutamate methylesterase n=1 Tax=Sphingomonas qilianensis TaxID=1736690 RepID=A0ABU9XR21_9SPHN
MDSETTIIVIGASAGGVEALRTIVAALPADLDAAVFVTLHIGAHRSDLPWLLARAGNLPAKHPRDDEPIVKGNIYVAPPDHHMLIEAGNIRLTKGPRENWARPAIDPMFRSAAQAFGRSVIGVILTGGLNDGTAGLFEVKTHGGFAIVQDPAEATASNMPQSALENVDVDHVLTAARIGQCLKELAAKQHAPDALENVSALVAPEEMDMDAQFTLNKPVAVTCPDCGGALRRSQLGSLMQFSCHIGHVYTMEVMLAAQFLAVERFVEQAMRSLSERAELCGIMAEKLPALQENDAERQLWVAARKEAFDQNAFLRTMLTREWIHPARRGAIEMSHGV